MAETTGKADFHYDGDTFQTWYLVKGDLKCGIRPLIVLHGGPGMTHHYCLPHVELNDRYHIPVVLYDQIGNGASTHLPDKPKEFWTTKLFMAELGSLLAFLEITDYDLLGHSWGGMLGVEWAATYAPKGLKHLAIISSPASIELWVEAANMLVEGMGPDMAKKMKSHEKDGTTDDPEYQEVMEAYYKKHANRLDPWPEEVVTSVKWMEDHPTVYHAMFGPSEASVTGTLKAWSSLEMLPKVGYPTLITNSPHDMAQDVCVTPFFEKLPNAKWVKFTEASHHPFWEEKDKYFEVVAAFLGQPVNS
ncbi:Alpha/Beta hydrolase protein [Armillaria mellea]|nr:Alpha/Beta hydrolase protein [Armillaria mellea]